MPPAPPPTPEAPRLDVALAIATIDFGNRDALGQPDPDAWRTLGYDLDGLWSDSLSADHCARPCQAAPQAIQTDGVGGIDNSFASTVFNSLSLLLDASDETTNAELAGGSFTIILKTSLPADLAGVQVDLPATLQYGAPLGAEPALDGTDVWDVASTPGASFRNAYYVDGTWVGIVDGVLPLRLPIGGFVFDFTLGSAVITMRPVDIAGVVRTMSGTIAGVLDTEVYLSANRSLGGVRDAMYCDPETQEPFIAHFREASDIMADGSNGDATVTCDGTSFAVGFSATQVTTTDDVVEVLAPPDPCNAG